MSSNRYERAISISRLVYFTVALAIYLTLRSVIDVPIMSTLSATGIFCLLAVTGFSIGFILEIVLLIKFGDDFRATAREEIRKSDLIKIVINFLLAVLFSYVLYQFVIIKDPDFRSPLVFFVIATMIYIGTAALCKHMRYIPIFLIFFRRNHERF